MMPKSGGPILSELLVSHAGKTTISHYLKNSQMMGFQELFIWLAQEHHLWRLMGVLASLGSFLGAHGNWFLVSHARKTTNSHYLKNPQQQFPIILKIHKWWIFRNCSFGWHRSITSGGSWVSWHLLGVPWAPMAAPGGSWWIYHFLFDYPDVTSHARDVSSYSPCMVVCNVSSYSIMLLCRRILIFS